ncbi:MAG: coproporphyrinogen-III oxidase family protein [Desulfosalsimonadaceae bacterium]|nr:coproporphyrinogen-III oxidase family protein [Desulfosalsimonadaceae bacterium]
MVLTDIGIGDLKNTHLKTSRRGYITKLEPSRKGFITNFPNFQHWKKLDSSEMLETKAPLNIYIHIPFCIQRCAYCYYKTSEIKGSGRSGGLDTYVNAICREIELASRMFQLNQRPVNTIYFGGGTPTVLTDENLTKIVETLHQHLIIDDPEFTVEAEPVTLTLKKAKHLINLSVNRISIGIQSFCDGVISLCERLDTADKALKAVDIAKSTGTVVNIDLLSGLAGETNKTWARSMHTAISTGVDSITVYKMELYANTKYYRKIREQKIDLPSDEQEIEFMAYALDALKKAEYIPWSFFTFTKYGKNVHRHSPSIWRGGDCYSFGASAFGCVGNFLFQNTNDVDKYIALLHAGKLPINRGHHMTSLDRMIRSAVLEMKLIHMDLNTFYETYGFNLESLCGPALHQLASDEFILLDNEKISLTRKGILHGDYVGKTLGRYLLDTYS